MSEVTSIYAIIYLNPDHNENGEDPHIVSITDDKEDIYAIIRKFGEEQVMNVLSGTDIHEVTELIFEERPKSFLVEINGR